jgi:hypothetical protein
MQACPNASDAHLMLLRYKLRKKQEVNDFGELTSGKSSALGMVPRDGTEVLQRCGGYTYEQGELRGRVGKERRGKEMDGCPLILPPLQKHGVTMHEDHQEVARSALVKEIEIESKMAMLIWC